MNVALDYLTSAGARLGLESRGVPPLARAVLLTPRFLTSSHIVFLLLPEGKSDPALVVKLPRSGGMSPALAREAAALEAIRNRQAVEPGTVPELVAFDSYRGHALLVETALVGSHLHRAAVRRDPASAVELASQWLLETHHRSQSPSDDDSTWFERLVTDPLDRLQTALGNSDDGVRLVQQTRTLVEPLADVSLPLVLVHGDFAHPNLIRLPEGRLGVVDWELGEGRGLPAGDFVFFLAYVGLACAGRRQFADRLREPVEVSAAHAALCGGHGWARSFVREYFAAAGLERIWLAPLCALAFARSLAGLLDRVGGKNGVSTGAWLRADRRFALWEHAVLHAGELE